MGRLAQVNFRRSQLASHKKRASGTRVKRFREVYATNAPVSKVNKKRSWKVAHEIIRKNKKQERIALLVTIGLTALAIFGLFMGMTYIFQYL